MNIKSLLIGSAAALAVVSGAQAADAIVAAEPEPMEYVRVCDAFGAGYFYIPGGETCLKISGYVRFQVDWSSFDRVGDDFAWNSATRGLVKFQAKNDTELGILSSTITVRAWADDSSHSTSAGDGMLELDEAYVTLGGFKFGYGYTYWDTGIVGETDGLANVARLNMIGYEYAGDAFKVGVFLDELNYATNDRLGVEALVSGSFGAVSAALLGGYDMNAEDGAVRAIVGASIGPGKLELAGVYASGVSQYFNASEWALAVGYEVAVTDKLKITPGFQYWNTLNTNAAGDFVGNADAWRAGVAVDYAITTGLSAKVSVQYTEADANNRGVADNAWGGYFRLERSF